MTCNVLGVKPGAWSNSHVSQCCQKSCLTRLTAARHCRVLGHAAKQHDLVTLGNLCVDVIRPIPQVPPTQVVKTADFLEGLAAQPDEPCNWELGGQTNVLISAARLGLRAAAVCSLGDDAHGAFLREELKAEQVHLIQPLEASGAALDRTLVCYVLVDPSTAHAFCSSYDLGPWPLLPHICSLSPSALQVLAGARVVAINGFVFDELPMEVVLQAAQHASEAGAAIFFDPGPRAWTMAPAQLHAMVRKAHVVLMTQEEATIVTGASDPQKAAAQVLSFPDSCTRWCIIKLGDRGAAIFPRGGQPVWAPAFQVDVADTVGCGDSFTAAAALGWLAAAELRTLLTLCNAVGAATATSVGAGRQVARTAKVQHLLRAAKPRLDQPASGAAQHHFAAQPESLAWDAAQQQGFEGLDFRETQPGSSTGSGSRSQSGSAREAVYLCCTAEDGHRQLTGKAEELLQSFLYRRHGRRLAAF